MADSEADIYELMAEATTELCCVDWIVRAAQDRALRSEDGQDTGEACLHEHVLTQPPTKT